MKKIIVLLMFVSFYAHALACDKSIDSLSGVPEAFKERLIKSGKQSGIIILKKEKKLLLITSNMCVENEFTVATGLNPERKCFSGDNATPEGIYEITQVNSSVEPEKVSKLAAEINAMTDPKAIAVRKEELRLMKKEYRRGKKAIDAMNSVYLSAKDGHAKYGTKEDLGLNSYGPAFLRLSYPNEEDRVFRKQMIKEKKVPVNADGSAKGPGSGIAIHGTNDNDSLGHDASSGCVRMKNEDLLTVLKQAERGTVVLIK